VVAVGRHSVAVVTVLLERDEQMLLLEELLGGARRGSGSVVFVAGEAGAGKSSLVSAFAARAGSDALVLTGYCDPLATPRALGPLHDMATAPDSGIADVLRSGDLAAVLGALLERLQAARQTVVLIIEDVHWADGATLDVLRFLGRRIGQLSAFVVCTYRDDEVGTDHPLRVVHGQLAGLQTTRHVSVLPLSAGAVTQLAGDSGIDAGRLYELTGGNAFFVTEVISGGGSLPLTVRDAVLARVSRLGAAARGVVEAVSIAPRSLEIDHALQLAGAGAADADSAVAAGVLVGTGNRLQFRHELARSAVEASLAPAWRLERHRRMIAMLQGEQPPDLARLAHHAVRAEDADLVLRYAPSAARQSAGRGAHREAAAFYHAALAHADRIGADDVARLRYDLAFELGLLDLQAESLEQIDLAIEHHRRSGQVISLALALVRRCSTAWRLHDIPGANASSAEAIDLLRPLGPSPELGRAFMAAGYHDMLAREHRGALELLAAAGDIATACGDADLLWDIGMLEGATEIVTGDAMRGAELLARSVEAADRAGNSLAANQALGMLGSGGGEARLYEPATAALRRAIDEGLARDMDYNVAYDRAWMARVAFEQGRWDEAADWADLVNRTAHDCTAIAMVTALGALGRVRVRRGDPGGRTLLEQVLEVEAEHEIQHVWSPICGLAEHHWLSGRTEEMIGVLERGYRRALDTDSRWARGELGYWMWRAGAIAEPPERAAEPFALSIVGRWREAADAWRAIGCPYEVALALADGDVDALVDAIEIFDRLGARPAANWGRARLRSLGAQRVPRGPRLETRGNPAGLTARQLDVVRLMLAGRSNADIADELYVSKKTVEHHVSAVYLKLGVATRAEAIVVAADLLGSAPQT
jgi:DNA-binding CsgD family transcriptional regulator/tetratricopeptide (TPR) repeat protein